MRARLAPQCLAANACCLSIAYPRLSERQPVGCHLQARRQACTTRMKPSFSRVLDVLVVVEVLEFSPPVSLSLRFASEGTLTGLMRRSRPFSREAFLKLLGESAHGCGPATAFAGCRGGVSPCEAQIRHRGARSAMASAMSGFVRLRSLRKIAQHHTGSATAKPHYRRMGLLLNSLFPTVRTRVTSVPCGRVAWGKRKVTRRPEVFCTTSLIG